MTHKKINGYYFNNHTDEGDFSRKDKIWSVCNDGWWLASICSEGLFRHSSVSRGGYDVDSYGHLKIIGVDLI